MNTYNSADRAKPYTAKTGESCECPEKPYVLLQHMKYPKKIKKLLCKNCYKKLVNSTEAEDYKVAKFFG